MPLRTEDRPSHRYVLRGVERFLDLNHQPSRSPLARRRAVLPPALKLNPSPSPVPAFYLDNQTLAPVGSGDHPMRDGLLQ